MTSTLDPQAIDLGTLRHLWAGAPAKLDDASMERIAAAAASVERIVADGTDDAARRLERVLWNDPATGVMRHADAGYADAIACALEMGLDLPMVPA